MRPAGCARAVCRHRAGVILLRVFRKWSICSNFAAIVNLAQEHKAKVIVIGAPYRDSKTNPPEAQLMTQYRTALKATMQQSQVPYLEILELTEAAGSVNEGFFGELIHPNHMGHRLMASEIFKLMAQQRLLK